MQNWRMFWLSYESLGLCRLSSGFEDLNLIINDISNSKELMAIMFNDFGENLPQTS